MVLATISYNSTALELDISVAAGGETITVAPVSGGFLQVTDASGITYNGTSESSPYSIAVVPVTALNVYLANSPGNPDTLTFGLGNSLINPIVNIGGPGTPATGSTPGTAQLRTPTTTSLSRTRRSRRVT